MSNDIETWKKVPGLVGIEASDQGRVRNRWGRILRGSDNTGGYRQVNVSVVGGGCRKKLVHRLVLEAFAGPCPPGMVARHLSGDPTENRLENLAWGTQAENVQDMLRHGTHWLARRTHCPRNHPLIEGNLVAAHQRRGRRGCLACDRARNYARYHGIPKDSAEFQAIADTYFAALDLDAEEHDAGKMAL